MTQTGTIELSNEQINKAAPSAFALAPHHEVSDRYGFMPTINVIDALRSEGWKPVSASQKNVRDSSKRELTKHLIRFRRLNNDILIGDSCVEMVLTNSHDRSSAFVLHAGLFRTACANGIVIADSTVGKLSVRHGKNVVHDIIEGVHEVIDDIPVITGEVEAMQDIELTPAERAIFAKTVHKYAFGQNEDVITSDNSIVNQMLRPCRNEDTGKDLWTTFNVLQEKAIRGGIRTTKINDKGKTRRNTSRAVKAIDKNIKLNTAIWDMAIEMKKLKQEA